jgi:hypothetical protein
MKKLGGVFRLVLNILAWISLFYFAYVLIGFKKTLPIEENVFSKEGIFYAAICTGILFLILSIEAMTKFITLEDLKVLVKALTTKGISVKYVFKMISFDGLVALRVAWIGMIFVIILLGYLIVPFFHDVKTMEVVQDVTRKVDTVVYVQKEDKVEVPLQIEGKEAALISTSQEMDQFMQEFYKNNEPFFAKSGLTVLLLKEGNLESFDGDFGSIAYSGENANVVETLQYLNYDTIWIFSAELGDISPSDVEPENKTIIVYSPKRVDTEDLKTYFKEVVSIEIKDLK